VTEFATPELDVVIPDDLAKPLDRLRDAASELGISLYLVGGPVRDWLLQRPLVDIDLLIANGNPKSIATLVRKGFGKDAKVREHPQFGTMSVEIGEHRVDLATLRKEKYARPGALPVVSPGTLEDDLSRRDFSVNALALPLRKGGGEEPISVIDLGSGLVDLGESTLRVFHPRSFHDDPTRALRAARLAARLGFGLSRSARSALRDALRDGAFGGVSGDRLRREFIKLFTDCAVGGHPSIALVHLDKWHVLAALEPGLCTHASSRAPLRRLEKVLATPQWRVREHRPWVAGLCLWLSPLSAPLRRRTLARLGVRGDTSVRVLGFAKSCQRWIKELKGTRGRGAVDLVLAELDEDQLLALYATCEPLLRRRVVRWAAEDRDTRIPVSPRDLLNANLSGPVVGVALARIRAAYLNGEVANREEGLALAREILRRSEAGKRGRRPQDAGRN
jgi:tRNA nucleotidyltransferase (CCA-adding enzyme)